VLNVHASADDKIDDIKDRFNEELEQVFDKFPRYHMKVLLGDFNAKAGRENIFKPTIGNESLHKNTNNNGARVVNFVTSKKTLLSKVRCFHIVTFIKLLGRLLMGKRTFKLATF
jgi:hypothetical protein